MKKLLLSLLISLPLYASAQIPGKKINTPYKATDGTVFKAGDTIQIGTGSRHDSYFVHIYQPANMISGPMIPINLSPTFTNRKVQIKFLKEVNNKRGRYTIAVFNPGMSMSANTSALNYMIDLESAISAKEIITATNKPAATETASKTSKSKAEQIKELKELLDMNAITQEEYDKEKTKIFNQ